jgi:hypothetical protein
VFGCSASRRTGRLTLTGIPDSSRRVHNRREPRKFGTARQSQNFARERKGSLGCTGKTARARQFFLSFNPFPLASPSFHSPQQSPAPLPLPPSASLGECERARGRACLAPRQGSPPAGPSRRPSAGGRSRRRGGGDRPAQQ